MTRYVFWVKLKRAPGILSSLLNLRPLLGQNLVSQVIFRGTLETIKIRLVPICIFPDIIQHFPTGFAILTRS
jgi:hypothetical protein